MSPELEEKLVKKFPDLFIDKDKPPTQSLMCFGCECDNGWFTLIHNACAQIANHLKHRPECPPVRFSQIKEKFGGLRLYYYGGDDFVSGVCNMAEHMSYHICEVTGETGQLCTTGRWLRTLSSAQADKYGYRPVTRDNDEDDETDNTSAAEKN